MDLLFKFVSVPICINYSDPTVTSSDGWDSGNPQMAASFILFLLVLHVTAIVIVIIFSQMPHIFNMVSLSLYIYIYFKYIYIYNIYI